VGDEESEARGESEASEESDEVGEVAAVRREGESESEAAGEAVAVAAEAALGEEKELAADDGEEEATDETDEAEETAENEETDEVETALAMGDSPILPTMPLLARPKRDCAGEEGVPTAEPTTEAEAAADDRVVLVEGAADAAMPVPSNAPMKNSADAGLGWEAEGGREKAPAPGIDRKGEAAVAVAVAVAVANGEEKAPEPTGESSAPVEKGPPPKGEAKGCARALVAG